MVALGEVVTLRAKGYQERLTTWDKFEPLLSQIRQKMDCTQDEAFKFLGYSGATMCALWKKRGVPILAVNAAVGVLSDLGEKPNRRAPLKWTYEELSSIFAVLNGIEIPNRKNLARKIAAEMMETE
jgi:DNA-binding XRE family transcriptional regulator